MNATAVTHSYCPIPYSLLRAKRAPCPTTRRKSSKRMRAFERGEIVVVMDDDGRENEGDLIVAAVHCTPEKMAFIVRHTSGIVCTPMPREEARRLNLAPMVADNDSAAHHRLHRQRRFQARHHHRHFGRRPHADRAQPRQRQCRRLRFRAPRPHLPADRPRRRRADALRPYRSRRRSLQARRPAAGRRHLRTGQRRRHGDARPAGRGLRRDERAEAGFGRRPHRLPPAQGNAGRARRHAPTSTRRAARRKVFTYTLPWDSMHHLAIVFGDIRDGEEVPVRLHSEDVVQRRLRHRPPAATTS